MAIGGQELPTAKHAFGVPQRSSQEQYTRLSELQLVHVTNERQWRGRLHGLAQGR